MTSALHRVKLDDLSDEEIKVVGAAIAEVARDLARTVPAPRGAPYFALDANEPDPRELDLFCQQGIFRKYERAVVWGAGLGGAARWWAVRFGCSVVAVDPRWAACRVAHELSAKAGLSGQTWFHVGAGDALALAEARFTHAWYLAGEGEVPRLRFSEFFRVLRPGGYLASKGPEAPGRDHAQQLQAAGFVSVVERALPPGETPQYLSLARRRLVSMLDRVHPARESARLLNYARGIGAADPRSGSVLWLAQKPS
jgi:SAM-dependent methyltransferase